MQERVYNKGKIANIEELHQHIVDEWVRLGYVAFRMPDLKHGMRCLHCALSTVQ